MTTMAAWTLIPQHGEEQRIRIQRLLMVSGASIGTVALTYAVAWADLASYTVAARYAIVVSILILGFYAWIRSGLNLRFSDPNLAIPQMVAAGLVTTYLVYECQRAQPAFLALYLVSLMFGMLSLSLRQLVAIAAFYYICFLFAVSLSLMLEPATSHHRELLRLVGFAPILGGVTAIGAYVGRLRRSLKSANAQLADFVAQLQILARVDDLTGCYNRRHGLELLGIECQRAARGSAVSVGMADVDEFKSINDNFGHSAGDEVLKGVAKTLRDSLRATDFVARYGGEEFLIVLSQTSIAEATLVAERLRRSVSARAMPGLAQGTRVTVSIGVTQHRPKDPAESTIVRADAALYRAKTGGRNRVVCAE